MRSFLHFVCPLWATRSCTSHRRFDWKIVSEYPWITRLNTILFMNCSMHIAHFYAFFIGRGIKLLLEVESSKTYIAGIVAAPVPCITVLLSFISHVSCPLRPHEMQMNSPLTFMAGRTVVVDRPRKAHHPNIHDDCHSICDSLCPRN